MGVILGRFGGTGGNVKVMVSSKRNHHCEGRRGSFANSCTALCAQCLSMFFLERLVHVFLVCQCVQVVYDILTHFMFVWFVQSRDLKLCRIVLGCFEFNSFQVFHTVFYNFLILDVIYVMYDIQVLYVIYVCYYCFCIFWLFMCFGVVLSLLVISKFCL